MLGDKTWQRDSSSFKLEVCDNKPGKNDELPNTLPVDERISEWLRLLEHVAGGKCRSVQLWGNSGGELSAAIGSATGELRGAGRKHGATMAAVLRQQCFSITGVL